MSSLDNALRILALLSAQRPVLKVGEVSRLTALPKTSVSRLLKAMGDHGLLEREGGGGFGYVPGPQSLVMGELYLARHGLLEIMERVSDRLTEEFGFVGYISKLEKDGLFIVRRKHGSYPLRLIRDVGQHAPAFQTASGRALLAQLPEEQALALTATDPVWGSRADEVVVILREIRARGVSLTISTGTPGVAATAAAVSNAAQGEMFAFSISYPLAATDAAMRLKMARRVWEEGHTLGRSFGDPLWAGRTAATPDLRLAVQQTETGPAQAGALVEAE